MNNPLAERFNDALVAHRLGNSAGAIEALKELAGLDNYPPAARELGNLCRDEDQGMARLYYEFAASNGDVEAAVRLGALMLDAQGQEYDEAFRWLSLAADQGNPEAHCYLGIMFETALGRVQDFAQAAHHYGLAATAGDSAAMLRYGRFHLVGRGVPVDPVLAYFWLSLASAAGCEEAVLRREWVLSFLSPEQIKKAQRAAVKWRPVRH